MLAKVGNRFERIGAAESQTLPAKLLHLLQKVGAFESLSGRSLDQIDVFACFKLKVLARLKFKPVKDRYVDLKDKSGERCVSIAFSSPAGNHQIDRF